MEEKNRVSFRMALLAHYGTVNRADIDYFCLEESAGKSAEAGNLANVRS